MGLRFSASMKPPDTRYEFEKLRHEQLSEKELEEELVTRGSDYATIRYHHNIHKVADSHSLTGG